MTLLTGFGRSTSGTYFRQEHFGCWQRAHILGCFQLWIVPACWQFEHSGMCICWLIIRVRRMCCSLHRAAPGAIVSPLPWERSARAVRVFEYPAIVRLRHDGENN